MSSAFSREDARLLLTLFNVHLQQAQQTSTRIATTKDVPEVFNEVTEFIPVVQHAAEICISHTLAMQDDASFQGVRPTIEGCNEKARQLHEMFSQVIGSSNAQEQYRMVAKGDRLEHVMKTILENMVELASSSLFMDALATKIDEIREALRKVKAIPDSLAEEGSSYYFHNSGTGWINANTGTGPQHNNNGSGWQFNGPIHGFQPPAQESRKGT